MGNLRTEKTERLLCIYVYKTGIRTGEIEVRNGNIRAHNRTAPTT